MLFERPDSGELAVIVHVDFSRTEDNSGDIQEFHELALSAGADPVAIVTGARDQPSPKFFVGEGKLDEIRLTVQSHGAKLVLFNHALSPSQERNLEKALECRVVDRTGLILDIFALRARTHEGKLQVELAQLQYQSTRLVRGWTHLERQKGGIGLRGPGETQLETDRRLLRIRMRSLAKRLEKVRQQRDQNRRARKRSSIKTISLVGYTNAGKSSLFNSMTSSEVYAADQLFATLDPTLRRLDLEDVGETVLADTVGFIRHLPHKLVESFRATLLETSESDLLLHVIDCADTARDENILEVEKVLAEIGAESIKCLHVYNKVDLLSDSEVRIDRRENGSPFRVWVSAQDRIGLDLLKQAMSELLSEDIVEATWSVGPGQGQLRALLYKQNVVLNETFDQQGCSLLSIRAERQDLIQILKKVGLSANYLSQDGKLSLDTEMRLNP